MDAAATQSAGGAPGRFEEVARNTAPPTAKAGGVGHGAPPQQTGVTGMRFAPCFTVWNGKANLRVPRLQTAPAEMSGLWQFTKVLNQNKHRIPMGQLLPCRTRLCPAQPLCANVHF